MQQHRVTITTLLTLFYTTALSGTEAQAHAAEQAFVLILPTEIYTTAGVLVVALTIGLVALLPNSFIDRLFRPLSLVRISLGLVTHAVSLFCTAVTVALIYAGLNGPRDPLTNPLPLAVWTMFWIALVTLQGLIGNLWHWLNPWTGLYALLRFGIGNRPPLRLPKWLGAWPAVLGFLMFGGFLLADPAPSDPGRLAVVGGVYWAVTFLGMVLFGRSWLRRCEALSVLMALYTHMAVFRTIAGRLSLGWPGWSVAHTRSPGLSMSVFAVVLLGTGSFDGLNETFRWLALLGINPLEFPGRSAVIGQTLIGLLIANAALVAILAIAVWAGLGIAKRTHDFNQAFGVAALAMLPIALGYHVGHYLTSFLVNAQYALAAASDPMATGADYLGLGTFYVTTGFFNTRDTVEVIWLCQAGAVVMGHVLSILIGHVLAVRQFGDGRSTILGQLPLALFMIAYTLFGLWLLAAPRGA